MDTNVNMNEVSRISAGTVFNGEISSSNDIRIDGQFEGRINSKGRLVVGERAVVNGDVMDFSGTMVKGTFYVMDTLSLKAGCSVDGDLRFKRLQVDLDAKINGNLRVLNEKEFDQIARQKAQEKPAAPAQTKVENGTVGKEQ